MVRWLGAGLIVGVAFSVAAAQQPPPPQPLAAQQRPVFRGGTHFVRVDAYPVQDGKIVEGLEAEDFEILEDGKPQKIDSFDFVRFDTFTPDAKRRDPSSQREGFDMAADPRYRVFVIVVDLAFSSSPGAFVPNNDLPHIQQPLVNFLKRILGPQDLFGFLTSRNSVKDLVLGQKSLVIESQVQDLLRSSVIDRDASDELDGCPKAAIAQSPASRGPDVYDARRVGAAARLAPAGAQERHLRDESPDARPAGPRLARRQRRHPAAGRHHQRPHRVRRAQSRCHGERLVLRRRGPASRHDGFRHPLPSAAAGSAQAERQLLSDHAGRASGARDDPGHRRPQTRDRRSDFPRERDRRHRDRQHQRPQRGHEEDRRRPGGVLRARLLHDEHEVRRRPAQHQGAAQGEQPGGAGAAAIPGADAKRRSPRWRRGRHAHRHPAPRRRPARSKRRCRCSNAAAGRSPATRRRRASS